MASVFAVSSPGLSARFIVWHVRTIVQGRHHGSWRGFAFPHARDKDAGMDASTEQRHRKGLMRKGMALNEQLTKLLANELATDNITVNAIAPGTVKTEAWMGPRADAMAKARGITSDEVRAIMAANAMLDRLAEPEEIGDVAAFLVSEKNSYMTGTVVEVCGGWGKYIG